MPAHGSLRSSRNVLIAAVLLSGISAVQGFVAGALARQVWPRSTPIGAAADRPPAVRVSELAGSRASLRPLSRQCFQMAVTDSDSWVRPPPRGKRDIVFGCRVSANNPVAPRHDDGCDLVRTPDPLRTPES